MLISFTNLIFHFFNFKALICLRILWYILGFACGSYSIVLLFKKKNRSHVAYKVISIIGTIANGIMAITAITFLMTVLLFLLFLLIIDLSR